MINDKETEKRFGYIGSTLSKGSHKKIISECDTCGKFRIGRRDAYRALCMSCAKTAISDETRERIAKSRRGTKASEETKMKMRKAHSGKHNHNYGKEMSQEQKDKISKNKIGGIPPNKGIPMSQNQKEKMIGIKRSKETRIKVSCAMQNIKINEWKGFVKESLYCNKFNEKCREQNRNKYNRECFICGKQECDNKTSNNIPKKLSVHHVDRNKNQGCNDTDWCLIPVCISCHGKVHTKIWENRIQFLIKEK